MAAQSDTISASTIKKSKLLRPLVKTKYSPATKLLLSVVDFFNEQIAALSFIASVRGFGSGKKIACKSDETVASPYNTSKIMTKTFSPRY